MFITPDLLFSYWIFAWFLIYLVYPVTNPLFGLWVALLENTIALFNLKDKLRFLLMIILFKVIPIYLLRKTKIKWKDVKIFGIVFIVYNIYLNIRGLNIIKVYKITNQSIQRGDNRTPFYYLTSFSNFVFT